MKHLLLRIVILLSFTSLAVGAQTSNNSVDSLSDELYNSSNRYTESGITYRVIKMENLNTYFSEIKTINKEKTEEIKASAKTIKQLEEKNKAQAKDYKELNDKYDYAIRANDAMDFFSILIPKKRYNVIMWGLVFILLALGAGLFLMFKRSHQVTRHAQKELEELKDEFEAYRKRTLRREQEVATSYLREINKLKGKI